MKQSSTNENSERELHELLFQMEKEFNLFNIRTYDGFPLWDIIRYNVYIDLVSLYYDIAQAPKKQLTIKYFFNKLSFSVKSIALIPKLLFSKADFFYLGLSRIQNDKGEYYDPFFSSVKHLIPSNAIFYDKANYPGKYTKENRVYDILSYIKRVAKIISYLGFKAPKKDNTEIEKIIIAINKSFEKTNIDHEKIEAWLDEFRLELYFFNWLFKLKKIKRLLLVTDGSKAIFLAAKINNVPSFEFQHGDIVESNIIYNYCYPEFDVSDNLVLPDYLLLFSDIWKVGKYIPINCIEIGTDYFQCAKRKGKENNSICIISSYYQNSVLQKLAIDLAESNQEAKLYYKLHPTQFISFSDQKAYFEKVPNIEVIPIEKTVDDMLSICDEFIAIYSTAVFQLLQSGKIVYLYKRLNYKSFKSYYYLPNLYLFEDAIEIPEIRKRAWNSESKSATPVFFKPFNEMAFSKAINGLKSI